MNDAILSVGIDSVPAGAWAVGVSGGADSVALLELLRQRNDLSLRVLHIDHELRGEESTADASFVRDLSRQFNLTWTIAKRCAIEATLDSPPRNPSARYRAVRMQAFRQAIAANGLNGVILAHHADDQAETILQRLLRGSGPAGMAGMKPRARIGGTTVLRPLLAVRSEGLRAFLRQRGMAWREDSSNQSSKQQRNRARKFLNGKPEVTDSLIELGGACATLKAWTNSQIGVVGESVEVKLLQRLPQPLAMEAARQWLAKKAGRRVEISASAAQRFVEMALDAATPPRQHFPGGLMVRRRGGVLFADGP